ncbi:proton-conducting transporter membrane subunit [Haloarchaeobius sp. HME9146]|uniref:proton-conducting transporter transmembrane domain-containing protein n=1 Tax=Haloarchaeobius sp. HME9146 TaxID=2978732 RepID=UPI0021C210DD|nr:proton-conducting transporter membrane subunit [Haloarchaeobius sp. HME9146]MCT9097941.1 proton-conducting transporter membrane subunit [Haloarchaeobius sp. HME9146]
MTDVSSVLPLAAVAVPTLAIVCIYATRAWPNLREASTLLAAVATLGVVWAMTRATGSETYVSTLGSVAGIEFVLRADSAGLLFALLASVLWLVTSVYSIGYVRKLGEHAQTRYFAAFAASIAATMGVAFAANLFTLFVFYELLTLATYPLVVHKESAEARAAGRTYVAYTLGGGVLVFAGIVIVGALTGTVTFDAGGIAGLASADPTLARVAFALLVVGFGVKTAIVPLHGWLPTAMVAPTPVSGLLHAVAVVKSGVFALGRTVLYVFGPETTWDLGMGLPLAVAAAATMIVAGVVGIRQDNLKRGLAYSTISQLSYIALGLAIATPVAVFGAFLHVVAHAFMKITLFFAAGVVYVETGEKYVSDIAGVGRRLPATMTAFAIAAAGLVGFPFVAGFVSKFYLVLGAGDSTTPWFVAAYLVAGVLKLLYFWPIVYAAFFGERDGKGAASRHPFAPGHVTDGGFSSVEMDDASYGGATDGGVGASAAVGGYTQSMTWERRTLTTETIPALLVPVLVTVAFAVALGIAPTLLPFWELAEAVVTEVFG